MLLQTPAAPQRQDKPSAHANVLTQMHKLQLQTPSGDERQGANTPVAAVSKAEQGRTAQSGGVLAADQLDVKALIQQEFARLMATKDYMPNQAAVLAVQNITKHP